MTNSEHGTDGVAKHWIGGQWRNSRQYGDSVNLATGQVIGRYALGGRDEANEAVTVARKAFLQSDWRVNHSLRSRVLNEMADRFEARANDLISLLATENGKVLPEARFKVMTAPDTLRYAAALVLTTYGRASERAAGQFSFLLREPVGVVGISVPWNSPVALLIRSLAPALAAGCTTVVKMPSQTAQVNMLRFSRARSTPARSCEASPGEGWTSYSRRADAMRCSHTP